ncbi:MAG TPA: hypothetical protein VMU54_22255 [Planctomycetota bacterium]|nr:hypothetical protein [Planctomycetota bacterium]
MRPMEELTMYANGLLDPEEMSATSAHVEACTDCAQVVERLRFERRVVQRAAARPEGSEAPADFPGLLARRLPARRFSRRFRVSAAGLLAAAGLLGALALLLLERPGGPTVNFAAQPPKDPLDRLIQEFRSPSSARKAMAQEALKAFGEAAAERLEKEGLDPELVRGEAALSANDLAVKKQVYDLRCTIDLQNIPQSTVLRHMGTVLGRPFAYDPASRKASELEMISFKVQDIVLDGALRLMLQPRGRSYEVRGGTVRVTARDEPGAYRAAPVRVLRDSSEGKALSLKLSSRDPAERDQAQAALRGLGFGAEGALWETLDSTDARARSAAGELLGRLYHPAPILGTSPGEALFRRTPFEKIVKQGTLLDLSEALMKDFGLSVGFDAVRTRPEGVQDEWLFGKTALDALSQLLARSRMKLVFAGDVALATSEDAPFLSTPWNGPAWTTPEQARELETLLADLASDDLSRHGPAEQGLEKLGADALHPLREAAQVFAPPAAQRCRQVRRRILDQKGLWMTDEASGADLQSLSEAQRKLLAKPVEIAARAVPLPELLEKAGVKATLRSAPEFRITLFGRALPTRSLLQAVTRPYGLDYYLDGATLVIDRAERVRAAVEK